MTSCKATSGVDPTRATAEEQIDRLREACNAADGGCAVLRAVGLCATHDLPMPAWLRQAYLGRWVLVNDAHAATWDAAFGRPWPKGTRLAIVRRHRVFRTRIHSAVWKLLRTDPTRSFNRILFDEVGELCGNAVSGSTAEKLYYEAVRQDGMLNIATWRHAQRDGSA